MEDDDLQALRNARMQQMQSQGKDQQKSQEDAAAQQKDMMNGMLAQLLDQNARARLNTLKISKPDKAEMVERMILQNAQMGRIGGKIDDAQLVQLLESLNQQMPRSNSKVNFDRRRAAMDSDDDDDYGI